MPERSGTDTHRRLFAALDRAAFEPQAWREVCDGLTALVGGRGVALIPVQVAARRWSPYSESLEGLAESYIQGGWYERDYRNNGLPVLFARGYCFEQDFATPEVMRSHPFYTEHQLAHNSLWFLGMRFDVNDDVWCVAVQGTPARGPFIQQDAETLMKVRQQLEIAATRAAASGFDRAENWQASFEVGGRAVVGLDVHCRVCAVSPAAEALLGGELSVCGGRLAAADPVVDRRIAALAAAALAYSPWQAQPLPPPVTVPRAHGPALSVEALPMPRDYQAVLAEVVVLLLIREVDEGRSLAGLLCEVYGLTPTEIRVALELAGGASLREVAEKLAITAGTARVHLKSIFAKTDTHRQAELVALMARLGAAL